METGFSVRIRTKKEVKVFLKFNLSTQSKNYTKFISKLYQNYKKTKWDVEKFGKMYLCCNFQKNQEPKKQKLIYIWDKTSLTVTKKIWKQFTERFLTKKEIKARLKFRPSTQAKKLSKSIDKCHRFSQKYLPKLGFIMPYWICHFEFLKLNVLLVYSDLKNYSIENLLEFEVFSKQ